MVTIGVLRGVLELEDRFSATLGLAARNLTAFSDNAERMGRTLSVALTAPLATIATLATKTFMSFDAAMRGVEAALRPTQVELQKLEQIALEWGSKTQFSATQAAVALTELGKAGFDVNESMQVLPDVLNLATVGQMSLADAATVTADTIKQMNLSVADATRVNDILAQGAQKSTADVNSLVQSLKFAGPVATGLGVSLEETVAMLAEFHNVGIKADIAGTSLRNILTDLANPTKGMRDALVQLGLETFRSADGTVKLADVIDTLRLKTDGVMSSTDRTALVMRAFGDRGGVAMTAVVNKGSEGFRKLVEDMDKADGAAQRVADTLLGGITGAWTRFVRAIEGVGIALGAVMAPALITLMGLGTQIANLFSNTVIPVFQLLPTSIQITIGAILTLVAVTGPAILIFTRLADVMVILAGTRGAALVSSAFFTLGNTIPVLTARLWLLDAAQKAVATSGAAMSTIATRGVGAALGALGGTLLTVVAVIGAVVGAVRLLTGSWEKTWDVLKIGLPPLLAIEVAWKAIKAVIEGTGPVVSSIISFFGDLGTVVGFIAQGALGDLWEVITDLGTVIGGYFSAGLQTIWDLFSGVGGVVSDLAQLFIGPLVSGFNAAWEVLKFFIPGIDQLDDLFRAAVDWGKQFAETLGNMRERLHEYAEALNSAMPQFKDGIPAMFAASKPAVENADQLIDRMLKLIDGEKELRVALGATTLGYGSLTEQLGMTRDAVSNLTKEQKAEIDAGIKLNKSTEDIVESVNALNAGTKITVGVVELYKQGQRDATRAVKEHNEAVKEHEAFQKSMRDSVWATTKDLMDLDKKRIDEAMKGMERSGEEIIRVLDLKVDAERETSDIIRQMTLSELEYKLDLINREGRAKKEGLDLSIGLHQQAATAIDQLTEKSMEQLITKSEEYRDTILLLIGIAPHLYGHLLPEAVDAGIGKLDKVKEKTDSWKDSLKELSQAFATLSEVGGGLGTFGKIAGEIVAATDIAIQSFDKVSEGIKKLADSTKKDLAGAFADIAIGLVGGFGAMMEATDPEKSMVSKIIGGAATGAALGGAIGATVAQFAGTWASAAGPWGAVAGAVVGVLVAVFRGREARREMEIVGAEWGQDISKGLFEAIHKSTQFNGDRVANSIFRMSEFITEAGGVDSTNLDTFTQKLHDVFSMLETGMFDVATAQKVINDNFLDIANASVQTGQLASDALLRIIQMNETMGVQARAIIEFVTNQTSVVGVGLQTIAGPITESINAWHAEVLKTQESLDKMSKDGKEGTAEWIAAQETLVQLSAQHGELVATNAADLENLGVVAVSTFAAAINSGVGYVAAVRAIGPGIDAVIAAQEKLGLTSENQAVKDLINFREKVKQNETLVAAAEALDGTLVAISHTTGLTEASLVSMGNLGVSTFDRLIAAGFSEIEALRMMGPFLQNLIDGHMDLGVPIDENLGRLINMADEFGILGKESKSFEETFAEGIKTLTDAINELIRVMRGVPETTDAIGRSIDRLPKRVPIDIEWNVPDLEVPGGRVLEAHGGLPMRDWGPEGTLVALHNEEGVYTADQMRDIYADAQSRAAGASASGRGVTVVKIDARGALLGDAASQQQLGRIVESAIDSLANQRRQVRA